MENIDRQFPLPENSVKIVVGLFFALLGILLTLDNLDLINSSPILRYWPAVLVIVGVLKMTERGNRVVASVLTIVGASLLANNARLIRMSIFDLWPLALILAGVLVVLHALGFRPAEGTDRGSNILAVLSQRNTTLEPTTTDRRVIAIMAGAELDLPAANPSRPPVVIEAVAMWAGIVIHVPEGWEIQGDVFPLMGGFEVTAKPSSGPTQKLIVRGLALMGGVEVKRRDS